MQVLLDFLPLGKVQLAFHPRQSLNLSVLGDSAFEFFVLDALSEHVDFVAVKILNAVNHHLLLRTLHALVLHEVLLLLEQFVLLQVARQLVYFLAKAHLLRIPLVHQTLLLVDQFFIKLLLSNLFEFHLPRNLFLYASLLGLSPLVPRLLLMRILPEKCLVLPLLTSYALNSLLVVFLYLRRFLVGRVCQFGKSNLGFGHVLGQDVVDVAVLFLLLRLDFLLPPALQDLLQLGLLLEAQLVSVLE